MIVYNRSIYNYMLKLDQYPLPAGGSLTIDDADWESDDQLARTIETLDYAGYITVSNVPALFPRTSEFPLELNLIGGSGTSPASLQRAQFIGNSHDPTIPDGGVAYLPWLLDSGDSSSFDMTNETQPKVLVSGVYSLTVVVNAYTMSPGGHFEVIPVMARNSEDAEADNDSRLGVDGDTSTPSAMSSITWYMPANEIFGVRVRNKDNQGVAHRFGILVASIQRVA